MTSKLIACFSKPRRNGTYEIDEFRIFIGRKDCEAWVCHAADGGGRTKLMLGRVVQAVLRLKPARIFTDGLRYTRPWCPEDCTARTAAAPTGLSG